MAKKIVYPHLCSYLKVTANTLLTSLHHTHDVELLSKIQYLSQELAEDWDHGIPRYEKKILHCGCPHVRAKQELLAMLLNEYNCRMYKPEDTRRMHLSERSL